MSGSWRLRDERGARSELDVYEAERSEIVYITVLRIIEAKVSAATTQPLTYHSGLTLSAL